MGCRYNISMGYIAIPDCHCWEDDHSVELTQKKLFFPYQIIMFREKMVPLEEREPFSFFLKKRLDMLTFHQKWHHFGSLGEPLWKRLPWGTKIVPPCKREPFPTFFWKKALFSLKGHYFSAPVALFLFRKCMGKQRSFVKWYQHGAPKGPVLWTVKWCPKGAILVPLIFLSVALEPWLTWLKYTLVDQFVTISVSHKGSRCGQLMWQSLPQKRRWIW